MSAKLLRFVAILVLLLSFLQASSAIAGPYEDGEAAADSGDFKKAIELWRPLAEQGNAAAQYSLGWLYRNGKGVK